MLTLEALEPRAVPAAFVLAGGVGYALDALGNVTRTYGQLVEPESRGVPFQVAVSPDGKTAVLGAGGGGGPRVIGLDLDTGVATYSVFVGDPASRSGVGVAWLADPPPPALLARPHAALPGDVSAVQREVGRLPLPLQQWVADRGGKVVVYSEKARLTDLPEFAHLRGVPTGSQGDGDRTYDQAAAAAFDKTAYLPADLSGPTLHEVGHVVEDLLPVADVTRFVDSVWQTADWKRWPAQGPTDYFRLTGAEAFAEGFAIWARRSAALDASYRIYFDSLATAHGWLTS